MVLTGRKTRLGKIFGCAAMLLLLQGCGRSTTVPVLPDNSDASLASAEYVIGPGDTLQVYVWDNPEISVTIPVRPDGLVTMPLVENMRAVGKTPSELARDIEVILGEYVRTPQVNIIVTDFRGTYRKQIRVVGQAVSPSSLSFQSGMTLLDVMIEVGGLTEFASGNRAKVIRWENGAKKEIRVRLKDLLNDGDIDENIQMAPGDVLIIPESMF
jgi:polysaccharide export outer membrane protein